MMFVKTIDDLFWEASVEEMSRGYVYDSEGEAWICLVCGNQYEKGRIYPEGEALYEAERYTAVHIREAHGSMFDYMLGLNKKLTGLTDLQRTVLKLFHEGRGDQEIAGELKAGSTATVRSHRFTLREKEKQAKVLLAVMNLLDAQQKGKERSEFVTIHRNATALDERYAITEEERDQIIRQYFPDGPEGRLLEFPKKEKRKIAILQHLIRKFEAGRRYTEKEINEKLKAVFADYVTLRRYFIEYGYMDREGDCSFYWVKL